MADLRPAPLARLYSEPWSSTGSRLVSCAVTLCVVTLVLPTAGFARKKAAAEVKPEPPAAPPPPASPVKPSAAIVHFDQGVTAFAENRFDEALTEFQSSMSLEPSPNTRIKIARCYKALGKIGSAYVQFHRAAHEAQDRMNATGEARFGPTHDAAEAEAQALESQVPHLELILPTPLPTDLTVQLDGVAVPRESWSTSLPIDPGSHQISASATRAQPFSQDFKLEIGQKQRITLAVKSLPTAELQLAFAAKPSGMSVFVDGQPIAVDDIEKPRLVDAGAHRVEVRAPGLTPFIWRGKLADQKKEKVTVTLRADLGGLRWAALALGLTAAAALGVGIGFGVVAQGTANDQMTLDPLMRDHAVQATVQTQANVATGMLAAGGVLGGTAIVLGSIALSRRAGGPTAKSTDTARESAWLFVPQLSPSSAGVAWIGRY